MIKERKDILAAKMAELNITTPTKTSKPKVMVKITNSAGSTGSGKKANKSIVHPNFDL